MGTKYPQTPSASSSCTSYQGPGGYRNCEYGWVSEGGDDRPLRCDVSTGPLLATCEASSVLFGGGVAVPSLETSVVVEPPWVMGEGKAAL